MVALAPYAPRFPFETWILPKRHQALFEDAPRHEYASLARLLGDILRRMNKDAAVSAVQPADPQRAAGRAGGGLLPLARGDHSEADEGGRLRVGDRVLPEPDGAGRSGARCCATRVASRIRRGGFRPASDSRPARPCRPRIAVVRYGFVASGNNSVVECDLAKVEVAGSNPVSRSNPSLMNAGEGCPPIARECAKADCRR